MRFRILISALLLTKVLSISGAVLAIRQATVFDSEAKRLVPDQTILICDERILAVGPTREIGIPSKAHVIEARGRYVIPGLIDAHTHVVTVLYWAQITGDELLPYYLAQGVTTIRNTGDAIAASRLVQRYAVEHPAISPRVFLASPLIDGDPPIHRDIGWPFSSPEQVPSFVEDMQKWGITTLKIYARCPPEVAHKVIEEGHRRGLVVTAHLGRYSVDDAIADGIDCLEHIESVSDFLRTDPHDRHSLDLTTERARSLVETLARRKIFVDPTLMVFWGTLFFADVPEIIQDADNAYVPRRLQEFWAKDRKTRLDNYSAGPLERRRATFRKYQELVGMLHRAGVPLLVGTDAPEPQVPPGYSLHHEMELLVESGLPPADVLAAATLQNARVLKQDTDLGTVAAGKRADLLILNGNPLENIRNSRKIYRVIKGGRLLDPTVILQSAPND
ncbi:MAG: hypothetical protein DMG06_22895 [Acidobacteria bacterium]|nr:MAG: hypothetical protein DMG06_22895 [Acidobacteriota bacterium]